MNEGVEHGFEHFHQEVIRFTEGCYLLTLTFAALQEYDQRINVHAVYLKKRVAESSAKGVPVNVLKWFH